MSVLSERDYSYGYWLNGMRHLPGEQAPNVVCFETGHYGFSVNMADFSAAGFSRFDESLSYLDALDSGVDRMKSLSPASLEIELESKGTVFRAVSSKTGSTLTGRPQVHTRMWESGRFVQRYDLQGLNFESADGRSLGVQGTLDIVAWPESLSFTAQLAPSLVYKDGWTQGIVDKGLCIVEKPWVVEHDPRLEHEGQTVEFWVKIPKELDSGSWGYLLAKNHHEGFPGYYSFVYSKGAVAVKMNFGGDVGLRTIPQGGHLFKSDAWNHLALSYDGNEMRYYINGQHQGTETIAHARPLAEGAMILGQRADGSGHVFPAVFDQLRIWSRALTAAEIQAHVSEPAQLSSDGKGLQYAENFDSYSKGGVASPSWQDVTIRMRLKTEEGVWEESQKVEGQWSLWDSKTLNLQCNVTDAPVLQPELSISVKSGATTDHPVVFNELYNAYGIGVGTVERNWDKRTPERDGYDDYLITVEHVGDDTTVAPLFFDIYDVAGITGATAIICDAEGRPTGVPVQLSKNWHDMTTGQYLRCFTSLPVDPGKTEYHLRIVYGFYGGIPAASHAQLSLVGWGNHGRWDQLAIGSWGETICFDTDMSCVDVAITDVRMLMARNGAEGKKWGWTDAGWGGDWLGVFNAEGKKLATTEMKASYLAQGPCLTDVRFNGHYGVDRQAAVQVDTSTLRTDDFARTFFKIRYDFDQELAADKAWLFKVGRTHKSISPRVAYGNRDGLLKEEMAPVTLQPGQAVIDRLSIEGDAPWWVGFPGGYLADGRDWGTGSRGLIIRSYHARFGGVDTDRPSISAPVLRTEGEDGVNLDLLLTAPQGVATFQVGDYVEMEVELITFHRRADDYYGPNEVYRQHLVENTESWKTIYREAAGNDLDVEVKGGTLLSAYPIVIGANEPVVGITVNGGNGKVPLRIEGLKSIDGYALYQFVDGQLVKLDQSVHGNDFWQTDYDLSSKTYRMTFNLPLDHGGITRWVLRRDLMNN